MLPFRELDCPELKQIQCEVMDYVENHTTLLNTNDVELFWNKINFKDFISKNKTLAKYCYSLGLILNEVAILRVYEDTTALSLHVDEAPLRAKINFPILNTKNTKTQWFKIPDELIESASTNINPFGVELPALRNLDIDSLELVGEVIDQSTPIVFNSEMPHKVSIGPDAEYPRIVLACMFANQPIDLLEE